MKAKTKQIEIEYIKFTNTPENLVELEEFFGDYRYVVDDDGDEPFLDIDDFEAAFINDYVIKQSDEFYVYGEVEFNENFDKID